MKRNEWKQATPQDQLLSVLMGVQGYVDNMQRGIYSNSPGLMATKFDVIQDLLVQAHELAKMVKGSWPHPMFEPIPNYGDKLSIEEYGDGYGYDGDGDGYWATDTKMSRINCYMPKPEWATQIIWFNK